MNVFIHANNSEGGSFPSSLLLYNLGIKKKDHQETQLYRESNLSTAENVDYLYSDTYVLHKNNEEIK